MGAIEGLGRRGRSRGNSGWTSLSARQAIAGLSAVCISSAHHSLQFRQDADHRVMVDVLNYNGDWVCTVESRTMSMDTDFPKLVLEGLDTFAFEKPEMPTDVAHATH